MSFLGDAWDYVKKAGEALVDAFKALGEALVLTLAAVASALSRMFPFLGCVAGNLGYFYASGWVKAKGGGTSRKLSSTEKRIMEEIFAQTGFRPDLDAVTVKTGVDLGGIPGSPGGLTLGETIYLARADVDACDASASAFLSLMLHELVHVAQYQAHGKYKFACEYGRAVLDRMSTSVPFEWEAYGLANDHAGDLQQAIQNACTEREEGESGQGVVAGLGSDWFWVVWS